MSSLTKSPRKIYEASEINIGTKKIEEAAVLVNKSDIPKVNGLFQQKFVTRFGYPPLFKHHIDHEMIVNGIPQDDLLPVIDFFKSYGCDVRIASGSV